MQKLELEKLNLLKLWKEGFLGIDLFSYQSWDTLPEEEEHALGVYGKKEPIFKICLLYTSDAADGVFSWFKHLEK